VGFGARRHAVVISDLTGLRVRAERDERDLGKVKAGQPADSGARPTPKVLEVIVVLDGATPILLRRRRGRRRGTAGRALSVLPLTPIRIHPDCVHLAPAATPLVRHTRRG
jgi:hypothetical protein